MRFLCGDTTPHARRTHSGAAPQKGRNSVVGDAGPEATRLDHYRHLDISNLFDGRNGMQNFACHECQALKFVRMPGTDSERH